MKRLGGKRDIGKETATVALRSIAPVKDSPPWALRLVLSIRTPRMLCRDNRSIRLRSLRGLRPSNHSLLPILNHSCGSSGGHGCSSEASQPVVVDLDTPLERPIARTRSSSPVRRSRHATVVEAPAAQTVKSYARTGSKESGNGQASQKIIRFDSAHGTPVESPVPVADTSAPPADPPFSIVTPSRRPQNSKSGIPSEILPGSDRQGME